MQHNHMESTLSLALSNSPCGITSRSLSLRNAAMRCEGSPCAGRMIGSKRRNRAFILLTISSSSSSSILQCRTTLLLDPHLSRMAGLLPTRAATEATTSSMIRTSSISTMAVTTRVKVDTSRTKRPKAMGHFQRNPIIQKTSMTPSRCRNQSSTTGPLPCSS